MWSFNIDYSEKFYFITFVLPTGTKQCYTGPLDLLESIRIALGDKDISHRNSGSSNCEDRKDKSQNNNGMKSSSSINEDVDTMRRRKVS